MNRNRFRLFSSDLVTIIASASCRECGSRGLLFILTHFSCAPVSAPFAPILSPSSSVPQGPSSSWARVCILSALMIRLLSELERATLFTCSVNSSWCVPHFSDFLKLCVRSQGVCLDVRFSLSKGMTVEGFLSAQRCFISPQSFVQLVSVCRSCQGQAFKFVWLGLHVSNLIVWNLCSVLI